MLHDNRKVLLSDHARGSHALARNPIRALQARKARQIPTHHPTNNTYHWRFAISSLQEMSLIVHLFGELAMMRTTVRTAVT